VARGSWGEYRFVESVGIGLIANLIAEVDRGDASHVNDMEHRAGRIQAALEVLADLVSRADPIRCDLSGDDFNVSGEYLLVEVMNFGAAGPNLRLAPAADGADGLLDVVVAEGTDRRRLTEYLAIERRGEPQPTPPLHIRRTRRVRVQCPKQIVHLDDELRDSPDGTLTIDTAIEPHALTFLIPAVAHRAR
jgi:diacylglycerol kinase (ATP)